MQGCNGLSSLWMIRSSYSSRAPLDSTAIDPITRSPNYHHETGKIEKPIKDKPLPCTKSTWARWWRSWLPQVGPPFLVVLARWRLVDFSPILHYGWATLPHIFTSPLSPQWTTSFKHLLSSWCFLELAHCNHGIAWSLSVHLLRFVGWSTWFTLWLSLDQPLTRPIFR